MLARFLSPYMALPLKALALPTRPCRTTLALVGKAYTATGQAGACLHMISILLAYQAELLKDLDKGKGVTPDAI